MVFVLDPQIIVPSFNEAISQLVSITLNRLGININSLPFWLSVVGYPLVMFEVFTKHIATAINIRILFSEPNPNPSTQLLQKNDKTYKPPICSKSPNKTSQDTALTVFDIIKGYSA